MRETTLLHQLIDIECDQKLRRRVTVQTGTKFEVFSRGFLRENLSFTAKIPSRSDLEWDFRELLSTPSGGREQ